MTSTIASKRRATDSDELSPTVKRMVQNEFKLSKRVQVGITDTLNDKKHGYDVDFFCEEPFPVGLYTQVLPSEWKQMMHTKEEADLGNLLIMCGSVCRYAHRTGSNVPYLDYEIIP